MSPTDGRKNTESGFTLIEIMIVIAIMAGLIVAGSTVFSSASQKRSAIRKLAVMTRDLRSSARLNNSTTRIAISMDDEKGHSYWVESAPGNVTLLSAEQQKELDDMTSLRREEEKPKTEFEADTRVLKKAQDLPNGLYFDSVEMSTREPQTSGVVYVHFFPQGLAEDAVIHLSDRKTLNWTIAINPLTGRADVYERKIPFKELRSK
jgi:prepilin-type N-terminal cleavage/methylation domain-containing protein